MLLDEEALGRTLSRIAHEVIERNEDLGAVALVGIWSRGVPLAHRLHNLIEERSGEEIELGQLPGRKVEQGPRAQRAQRELDWSAKVSLEEGLRLTLEAL